MSITINKKRDGYTASGLNTYGRFTVSELKGTESVSEAFDLIKKARSAEELEKEKLLDDKTFLLDEFIKGKTEEEIIKHKDKFIRVKDEMEIKEGSIYRYADGLFKALKTFTYDNQHSPILEELYWQEIGIKKLSEYQERFRKAPFWMSDNTYKKGDDVQYYGKLYTAKDTVKDGSRPDKSDKWELVNENI